jgi:vitamin B12 transporter
VKYPVLLLSTLAIAAPALAEEAEPSTSILVTGHPLPLSEAGQSVSVIGADEIASVQGADLTRVLERLPGVAFSRNGGLGAQTGVFVRGANADQLLVIVDGVRIADYASPGGSYDLGNLMSGDLERIELLRGSNSVVWGSQAIGGVLAATTLEVDGVTARAEHGADDTTIASAAAGFAGESSALSLGGGYARTDGFSARSGGAEPDGYRQWHISGKGRLALADGLALRATGRYADSRLDTDQFGPDSDDFQKTREATGRVGIDYADGDMRLAGGATYTRVRRDYDGMFGPSRFTGSARRVEAAGHAPLGGGLSLDVGADSEWQRAGSTFDPRAKSRLSSGHALLGWRAGGISLAAGARLDDHSRFGTHVTLGANGSLPLAPQWRVRASYGEGFKAPTLYQLFGGFVGNPALRPETSRSADIGIERGERGGEGLHAALSLFRRDSRNLIDLDSGFVYQNVARARAEGAELELGARPSPRLHVQAAYTYLKATDRTQHRALARRPRHALTLSADWTTPLTGLELGADLRMASDAVEYDFSGSPTRLDGYAVATVRARLPVTQTIELTARVENMADTKYETAATFATPGRSAYIGARARF